MKRVLVTNAHRHTGKTVAGELAVALPGKCEVVATILDENERDILEQFDTIKKVINNSDYLEPLDFMDDMKDVDEMVLIPSNMKNKVPQARNLIDACVEMKGKIKRIILISMNGPHEAQGGPSDAAEELKLFDEIETYLRDSEFQGEYTILRTNPFSHVLLLYRHQIAKNNELQAPAGDGKVALLDMDDVSVAVRMLVGMEDGQRKKHDKQIYRLTGSRSMTFDDMCSIMSKVTGKSIKYKKITRDEAQTLLLKTELPELERNILLDEYDLVRAGKMDFVTQDFRKVTGKDPTTFEKWCQDHSMLLQMVEEPMEE